MPSESGAIPLHDILYHIELAQTFAAGFSRQSFRDDLRTVFAVTRCLEIISEASRRLPLALKDRHSSIAWRRMAGAGNVYRHDYEDVAANYVWNTVQNEPPPLRRVIEQELRDLGELP
jgi:uncharacterized protein with HEPN domain